MKAKLLRAILVSGLAISCVAPSLTVGATESDADDLSVFESGETVVDDKTMEYRLYDPSDNGYEAESYPLVLFLHGEDAVGDDNEAQLTANRGATLLDRRRISTAESSLCFSSAVPGWRLDDRRKCCPCKTGSR